MESFKMSRGSGKERGVGGRVADRAAAPPCSAAFGGAARAVPASATRGCRQAFHISKYLIILLSVSLLTGCWDKVELEERAYVISVGVDKCEATSEKKDNDIFSVSMAIPNLSAFSGKDSAGEKKSVKTSTGKTIPSAIRSTDASSGKKLYFEHTKLIVINEEILKDESLLFETFDAFERDDQIGGRTIVLCSKEKAKDILDADPPAESMVGMFVSSFFKSGRNTAGVSFKQDLTGIIKRLRSGGNVIIPKIELKDKELKIGGGAVIKDSKFDGWLTENEMRGYLWIKGKASGAVIDIEKDGTFLPLNIKRNSSKTVFIEDRDTIICQTDVKVEGSLDSYSFGKENPSLSSIKKQYELLILDEIIKADEKIDLFSFEIEEQMQKRSCNLYSTYKNGEKEIKKVWKVVVEITGTGELSLE